MMAHEGRGRKAAFALALSLAAALPLAPLAGHQDDSDAHLYTVVARRMAEGGSYFDPSYLPGVYPHFREHLPFGFWPWALALGAFGERALYPLALALSLGALLCLVVIGRRLLGFAGALAALLLLATTESFFRYAALPHLDRLLFFCATAASLPLLEARPVALRGWALAAALSALATLVKGPFGLLPLAAAGLARAVVLRDARELLAGALATLLAAAPGAAFLLADRFAGGGTWWRGYLLDQLLASTSGARKDGEGGLLPFSGLWGRFWPGLPFALFGLYFGLRDLYRRRPTATALLAVFSLALLGLLTLPSRKVWHHAMIAWPALALLGGAAAAPLLEKLLAAPLRARRAFASLAGVAAVAVLLAALGAGARLSPAGCVLPTSLISQLPRDTNLLLVAPQPDWKAVAALAAEHRLAPWPAYALAPDGALETWPPGSAAPDGRRASLALVREGSLPKTPGEWREEGREAGWVLLRR